MPQHRLAQLRTPPVSAGHRVGHRPAPPRRDHAARRPPGVLGPFVALVALGFALPWALGLGEHMPVRARGPEPLAGARPARLPAGAPADRDEDGLADGLEDALLRRYAPTVLLSADDPSLPASVGWVRSRSGLDAAGPRRLGVVTARHGFDDATRRGSADPADWTMYGHAYRRADGGLNLQYWFYHPFNESPLFLFHHESDWEHVTVELGPDRSPRHLALARHANNAPGVRVPWERVPREGEHPFVLSARGTHASYLSAAEAPFWERVADCPRDARGVPRLEGCPVLAWRAGGPGRPSPLANLGERPAAGADVDVGFLMTYGGLWGEASILPRASPPPGPPYQRGFCTDAAPGACP